MGHWNMVQFIIERAIELADFEDGIQNADTYEKADACAKEMLGYIHCLDTIDRAISVESNEYFAMGFCEDLSDWEARCYDALGNKASATEQSPNLIKKLFEKRDELRGQ